MVLKFFVLSILSGMLICCTANSDLNSNMETHELHEFEEFESSNEPDHQLSEELKNKLLETGIDTVLLFKRTCIGCCDFYNVFWENGDKVFIHKFYYDTEMGKNRSIRVQIESENIFKIIQTKYSELKQYKIRENSHFVKKEGDIITIIPGVISSHYCYSTIKIYSQSDSLFSGQIKDSYFNMFTGVNDDKGNPIANDNYEENVKSDWYSLLIAIENEIYAMKQTNLREKEIGRIKRIENH